MTAQLESPPEGPHPRRGSIRRWLLVMVILALIWNVGSALEYVPAAIRSLAPSSDAGPSPLPGPVETQGQPAVPMVDAVASETPAPSPSSPVPVEQSRVWEPNARSTITNSALALGYSVQVAAVEDAQEARTLSNELSRAGYSVYLTEATVRQIRFHRVRVGPFQTRQAAQQVAQRLETQGYNDPWITQ